MKLIAAIAACILTISGCVSERYGQSVVLIETDRGRGTGFFIEDGRIIITAAHVVGASQVVSVAIDGRRAKAAVLKIDRKNDVAVLVTGLRGRALLLSCDRPSTETEVLVIGHPLGWKRMYTRGSTMASSAVLDGTVVPVDVLIAPGNSGSPAISKKGRVLGIMVAMVGVRGHPSGIALMVPGDLVCESIKGAYER